jgi:hypothetical protein
MQERYHASVLGVDELGHVAAVTLHDKAAALLCWLMHE